VIYVYKVVGNIAYPEVNKQKAAYSAGGW